MPRKKKVVRKSGKKKASKRGRKKAKKSLSPSLVAMFMGIVIGAGLLWLALNWNTITPNVISTISSSVSSFQKNFTEFTKTKTSLSGLSSFKLPEAKKKVVPTKKPIVQKKKIPVVAKKKVSSRSVKKSAAPTKKKVAVKTKAIERATPPKKTTVTMRSQPKVERKVTTQTVYLAKPEPVPAKALNRFSPKIVFVIDDVGYHLRYEQLLYSAGAPLTIAILPQLDYSEHFSREARRRGYEVILHQPMEPLGKNVDPGPGVIKGGMRRSEVERVLDKNLRTVPGASGINNHMGSKATQDGQIMNWVISELKDRNMFFLDSMTSNNSMGWRTARSKGLPYLKRSVFIDNEDDAVYIANQIGKLIDKAKKEGYAIGIGHYKRKTLETIRRMAPQINRKGVQIVRLREVVKR